MDVSIPCDNSAWGYVNSASDDVYADIHAHVNDKKCRCSIRFSSEENVVAESGNSFSELEPIQELMSGCSLATSERGIYSQEKKNLCEEHKISSVGSEKVFVKCATFPCSVSRVGNVENPDMACDGIWSGKSDKPACTRSISLPTSLKPVSALKGSRERQGTQEKTLTVTWAPDVYDPPVTSVSHSVRSYIQQQHPRTNKKNSKHKHKGKSSSRANSEKKQPRKPSSGSDEQ